MLNVLQLEKLTKEDVIKQLEKFLSTMNNHQFTKLKKTLNKRGMLDDIRK